jgi:hypothetical protein
LQEEADAALAEAEALKLQDRLEDRTMREREKVKQCRKGYKTYTQLKRPPGVRATRRDAAGGCAQEDRRRGGKAEDQGSEGEGGVDGKPNTS